MAVESSRMLRVASTASSAADHRVDIKHARRASAQVVSVGELTIRLYGQRPLIL